MSESRAHITLRHSEPEQLTLEQSGSVHRRASGAH